MNTRGDASGAAAPATAPPLSQRGSTDGDQQARTEDLDKRPPLKPKAIIHALGGFLVVRR